MLFCFDGNPSRSFSQNCPASGPALAGCLAVALDWFVDTAAQDHFHNLCSIRSDSWLHVEGFGRLIAVVCCRIVVVL